MCLGLGLRVTCFSALCCAGLGECSLHQMSPAASEGLSPGKLQGFQMRELLFAHMPNPSFLTIPSCPAENACQAGGPDEPAEAGSGGKRPGQCGERRQRCWGWGGSPCHPCALATGLCSLIPQMYVQHDIYDLIFKYVGTIEASEVGPKSPASRLEALYSKLFKKFETSLKSVVRMLPLIKSQEAFKIFSRRTLA